MTTYNEDLYFKKEDLKRFTSGLQKESDELVKVSIPESVFEFQKSITPMINSFRETMEPAINSIQSTMKTMEPLLEQTRAIAKQFERLQKKLRELSPKREKTIERMSLNGWTISGNEGFYLIDKLEGMDKSEIDSYLMDYYSKNNYEKTFEELDLLIETLDLGYKDQMSKIKKILELDINNYKVVIPTLFTILEYVYDKELGFLNTNNSMKFRNVEKAREKLTKNENDNFLLVMLISAYSVLQDDLEDGRKNNIGFSKGTNGVKYSRHSVLHGRIDPNRLKIKDLIQLVVLISAVYTLASLEKEYM